MRKAIIKTRSQIEAASSHYNPGDGWQMRGQYFPESNLRFSGIEVEVEAWENGMTYQCKINGEWHFLSVDALEFLD